MKITEIAFSCYPVMAFINDPDGNTLCIHKRKPGHN
jgi:hypothetical protein